MMCKGKMKRVWLFLGTAVILTCYLAQKVDCSRLTKTVRQKEADVAKTLGVQEGRIVFGKAYRKGSSIDEITSSSNASVEGETSYQADFTGWSKGQTKQADSEELWKRMAQSLQCGADQMKYRVVGPGASQFALDQGDAPGLPLSQVPPTCGYTMQKNSLALVMLVPYDGCNVVQEGGNYVLSMLWYGIPVSLWCTKPADPASTTETPTTTEAPSTTTTPPTTKSPPQSFIHPYMPFVKDPSEAPQPHEYPYFHPPFYFPWPLPTTAKPLPTTAKPRTTKPPPTTAKRTTAKPATTETKAKPQDQQFLPFPTMDPTLAPQGNVQQHFHPFPFPWGLPTTAKPETTATKAKQDVQQLITLYPPVFRIVDPTLAPRAHVPPHFYPIPFPMPLPTSATVTRAKPQGRHFYPSNLPYVPLVDPYLAAQPHVQPRFYPPVVFPMPLQTAAKPETTEAKPHLQQLIPLYPPIIPIVDPTKAPQPYEHPHFQPRVHFPWPLPTAKQTQGNQAPVTEDHQPQNFHPYVHFPWPLPIE